MYLSSYEHPYDFITQKERTNFESQMTSQYMILVKLNQHLPDLKTFSLDLCYYYFVDVMLAREGMYASEMTSEEYSYHVNRFKHHPDIVKYCNDMMTFFISSRYANQKVTHKGGSFSCIDQYMK